MISGEYKNALDEKGRILIPSRIRSSIEGNMLILTRGVDKCLWLFTPLEWSRISALLMDSSSIFKAKARLMQRRIVAPAQECEIDKAGRINIPPTLRDAAGLKKEVLILGMIRHMEIWDEDEYQRYLEGSEDEFLEATEELGDMLSG